MSIPYASVSSFNDLSNVDKTNYEWAEVFSLFKEKFFLAFSCHYKSITVESLYQYLIKLKWHAGFLFFLFVVVVVVVVFVLLWNILCHLTIHLLFFRRQNWRISFMSMSTCGVYQKKRTSFLFDLTLRLILRPNKHDWWDFKKKYNKSIVN